MIRVAVTIVRMAAYAMMRQRTAYRVKALLSITIVEHQKHNGQHGENNVRL